MEAITLGQEVDYPKVPYKENFALVERQGPHGMFKVYLERGETPNYFKDAVFTSYELAKRSIENYLAAKQPTRAKVK